MRIGIILPLIIINIDQDIINDHFNRNMRNLTNLSSSLWNQCFTCELVEILSSTQSLKDQYSNEACFGCQTPYFYFQSWQI